jgi:hypothetical protein
MVRTVSDILLVIVSEVVVVVVGPKCPTDRTTSVCITFVITLGTHLIVSQF